MKREKILITGETGFVGSNLSSYLKTKDFIITPITLRKESWISEIPNDIDVYIHLAGKAHDIKRTSNPEEYIKINTNLSKEIFDQFLNSKARIFIYFSSVKAAAESVNELLTEEVKPQPINPYGKSKLLAEEYMLSKELNGKRLIIVRPCMIHGKGNKGNLNLLYKMVLKGIPYPFGRFKNKRSFLSIDNLNFLIEKVLREDAITSGIYNFADDGYVSTQRLIELISEEIGIPKRILNVPKAIIYLTSKLGDFFRLPINSYRLDKLTETYLVSNNKIKRALQLNELPQNIELGLRKTIRSFKN